MKNVLFSALGFFTMALSSSHAAISLLAGWDFQGGPNGAVGTVISTSPTTPTLFNADDGLQSGTLAALFLNGTQGSSSWTTLTAFAGTSLNTGGTSLSTLTASPASLGLQSNVANGNFLVIKFSMTGFEDLVLTYATQASGTGFNSNQWAYSTDGSSFVNVGGTIAPPAAFAVQTVDFSAISAIENIGTVWLRYTVNGASSSTGNNRLDNIQLNASTVPEAGSALLMLAGLGLMMRRQRKGYSALN